MLTLFTTPVVYLYFDKLAQYMKPKEARDQGSGIREQETASVIGT
jgi:hypothetical protein